MRCNLTPDPKKAAVAAAIARAKAKQSAKKQVKLPINETKRFYMFKMISSPHTHSEIDGPHNVMGDCGNVTGNRRASILLRIWRFDPITVGNKYGVIPRVCCNLIVKPRIFLYW